MPFQCEELKVESENWKDKYMECAEQLKQRLVEHKEATTLLEATRQQVFRRTLNECPA